MIKYRPHGGSLARSMNEAREFETLDEMYEYIVRNRNELLRYTKEDLSVSENYGKDDRIDWKETRYVCTKRLGNEVYDVPQCIGYCSIEGDE